VGSRLHVESAAVLDRVVLQIIGDEPLQEFFALEEREPSTVKGARILVPTAE